MLRPASRFLSSTAEGYLHQGDSSSAAMRAQIIMLDGVRHDAQEDFIGSTKRTRLKRLK